MIRYLHQLEEWVLIALLSLLTLLGFTEAFLRQIGQGALWLPDMMKWVSAWFLLFGMAYGVRTHSHIGLTILTSKIHYPVVKRIIAGIAVSICLAYCIIFLMSSYQYVLKLKKIGFTFEDLTAIPLWIPYSGLLFGFSLLIWRFLVLFYAIIIGKTDGFGFIDEARDSVANFSQNNAEMQE